MREPGILPIRISLLGAPEVRSSDGGRNFPLPRRTLDVLAYLLLHRGRALPRAAVAFELFPDDEEELARNSLRRNLSYLLSALPEAPEASPFVRADGKALSWNPEAPATIDVDEFEAARGEGRVDDALRVYRGELLPTLYADWTMHERERLRVEFHDLLLRKAQEERSLRRFDEASAVVRMLLDDDPWRENAVRLAMAIRHEAGDRSGALAEFERFTSRLKSEMRAEPMLETIAVRDAVIRGDVLPTSERAGSASVIATPKASFGLPFVGREVATKTARARWHLAADRCAGMLFVAGEAGIGKSRFATELARAIEHEGGTVLRGQTTAGGERQPYEAFVDALKYAAPQDRVERLWDAHAHATLTDDRAARVRFFESVRAEIAELARVRPVTIVLEDLHWAGRDTIALLEYVAERLGQAPVLIVVTMRTDELARAHPLRTLSRRLESGGSAEIVTLKRLAREDAVRAVAAAIERNADESVIAQAAEWADGVPLLLLEAVREIAAGRTPARGDIASLVGDRFARLGPAATTALIYSATVGNRFELATVAAATGWSDAAIIDALGESVELGLVRAAESCGSIAFAFTHHVLHAAAYERIAAPERARAHAMVARVLEASPESLSSGAAEVARHFEKALEANRAARYWAYAARYALSIFANEEARETATAGLAVAGDDDEVRYDLLAARENALRRIGALAERRVDSLALVECAGENLDRRCEALERVFRAHAGEPEARRSSLERLAELAPLTPRYAAVYDRAVSEDADRAGNYEKARDAALRAAERFDRLDNQREATMARIQHVRILGNLHDYRAAESAIAALRPLMDDTDDIAVAAEFYRVASAVQGDERPGAIEDARRSLELALRIGDRYGEAVARQNIAVRNERLRNFAGLAREHKAALAAFADIGDSARFDNAVLNLAAWQTWCGAFGAARTTLKDLGSDALPSTSLRAVIMRGQIDTLEGRLESAAAELSSARDEAARRGLLLHLAYAEALLARLHWVRGDLREARRFVERALDALSALEQLNACVELRAFLARLYAESGEKEAALCEAAATVELLARHPVEEYSRLSWDLAVAFALAGNEVKARHFAAESARALVEDALQMDADDAESYCSLPWHCEAIAFLSGRWNASGTLSS